MHISGSSNYRHLSGGIHGTQYEGGATGPGKAGRGNAFGHTVANKGLGQRDLETSDAFRAAEVRMLDIRQGIRHDLEDIAARLQEVFGDDELSSEVKGLGKDFKDAVQAALEEARTSIRETGDFDQAALEATVQAAFEALRDGLTESLGVDFGGGGEGPGHVARPAVDEPAPGGFAVFDYAGGGPTVTEVERLDPPTAPDRPEPGDPLAPSNDPRRVELASSQQLTAPSAPVRPEQGEEPQVGERAERDGFAHLPEDVRESVRKVFERLSELIAIFEPDGPGIEGLAYDHSPLERLAAPTRSYVESLLSSIAEKGKRIDAAG